VKVGAAPYFDLQTWNPRGDSAKKLRAGVNQARRAGVEIEIAPDLSESLKSETAQLCIDWLGSRTAATTFGWLVALDPFMHAEHKKYFAARINGNLIGFLAASPIPARKGWYLEDVISDPNAPQGTATFLVVEALKRLKEEGQSYPQLVIIDGGKGQLSAAMEAVTELELSGQMTLIGLAKNEEEVFFPGDSASFKLPYNSESLRFIRNIRDEVHRFGIMHFPALRGVLQRR